MGYVTVLEAERYGWNGWIKELACRVILDGDRWYAADSTRDPKQILRGRLEALGPVFDDDPLKEVSQGLSCCVSTLVPDSVRLSIKRPGATALRRAPPTGRLGLLQPAQAPPAFACRIPNSVARSARPRPSFVIRACPLL